ncbi:PA4642 family protein [Simiduia curdlanivorans]|uniref:PA4642 family protein n=1 Tax=Simiduia curdlanivorans TaxID=1492769 RepID=A0ABV8V8K1_9GAMM|nr:PA4642 family protein [Simiduia curdlanivorans]MDN3638902.1 PA4642 family protein [Simiduia curdlanivorans]
MSLKKDKQKVLGEVFSDEQVKTFLDVTPPAGIDADFHCLEKAYRGMVAENFATFVRFFLEAGRDINATNADGHTLLTLAKQHRQGDEYAAILADAGAH